MNAAFWNDFYAGHDVPALPSAFAQHVHTRLQQGDRLIDIGCGNGRDSLFFAEHGHKVFAMDQVKPAVFPTHPLITFIQQDVTTADMTAIGDYDVVYARFLFHAVSVSATQSVLKWIKGRLFAEFRAKGDVPLIYPDHERVFWDQKSFETLLHQSGFDIISFDAARGRAIYGDEDPLVFRLEAVK